MFQLCEGFMYERREKNAINSLPDICFSREAQPNDGFFNLSHESINI